MISRRSLLATIGFTLITGCVSNDENESNPRDSNPDNQSRSSTNTTVSPAASPEKSPSPTASPDPGDTKGSTATDDSAEDIRLYNNTDRTITVTTTVTDQSTGETILSKTVSLDPPDQWYRPTVFESNHDYTVTVKVKNGQKKSEEFISGNRMVISVEESNIRIRTLTH